MITFEITEQYSTHGYRYKIETKHLNYKSMNCEHLTASQLIDAMQKIANIMNNEYNEDCDFVVG